MELLNKTTILTTHPFIVERVDFCPSAGSTPLSHYRLNCPDWVNVLALTSQNDAVMIRQPRVGSFTRVLETPGGVIEASEKDPTMAAVRELEEETGYTSSRILPLGSLNPNPALMTNRTHFFLALGCSVNPTRKHFPDPEEEIQIELIKPDQLDFMVRTGVVNHALSALCIMLAQKYLRKE